VNPENFGGAEITGPRPGCVFDQFATELLDNQEGSEHQDHQRGAKKEQAFPLQAHRCEQAF
jgi:hypothetical protein